MQREDLVRQVKKILERHAPPVGDEVVIMSDRSARLLVISIPDLETLDGQHVESLHNAIEHVEPKLVFILNRNRPVESQTIANVGAIPALQNLNTYVKSVNDLFMRVVDDRASKVGRIQIESHGYTDEEILAMSQAVLEEFDTPVKIPHLERGGLNKSYSPKRRRFKGGWYS